MKVKCEEDIRQKTEYVNHVVIIFENTMSVEHSIQNRINKPTELDGKGNMKKKTT